MTQQSIQSIVYRPAKVVLIENTCVLCDLMRDAKVVQRNQCAMFTEQHVIVQQLWRLLRDALI